MLINLRNALTTGKRTPTAKDYVQDGLIAMWDGIENAGFGQSNRQATEWVDCIGGLKIPLTSNVAADVLRWEDGGGLRRIGTGYIALTFPSLALPDIADTQTVEFGVHIREIPSFADMGTTNMYWVFFASPNSLCCRKNYPTGYILTSETTWYYYLPDTPDSPPTIMTCSIAKTSNQRPNQSPPQYYCYTYKNGIGQASNTLMRTLPSGGLSLFGYQRTWSSQTDFEIMFVRWYNRLITASEIAANYAVDAQRFNLPTT